MSLRLILMRHAKSDWGAANLRDHERPLNPRGRRDAAAMGDWLRRQGYLPDQVLCSTATRTRETLDLLALAAPVRFEPALYHASPEAMLAALRQASGGCVLMLGHNPGIAGLAADLVQDAPDHERFDDYPTCATLVAEVDLGGWAGVRAGSGHVLDFTIPADLR